MEYIIYPTNKRITFPARGYFKLGDKGESIAIISSFLACNFMGYETITGVKIQDMLGDYFGNNFPRENYPNIIYINREIIY